MLQAFVARLKQLPELADVASDQQTAGRQAVLTYDRATASRLGITAQSIDDALYDSFGQRQISTLFTQLNQYHVILEVDPLFQVSPDELKNIYLKTPAADGRPFVRGHASLSAVRATADQPHGAISGDHRFLQSRAGRIARRGGYGDSKGAGRQAGLAESAGPAGVVSGHCSRLRRLAFERGDSRVERAVDGLYRARSTLRELHPPDHDTLDAAVGCGRGAARIVDHRQRAHRRRDHRHRAADRHRAEERDHDDRLRAGGRAQGTQERLRRRSARPACCVSGRSS